MAQELFLSHLKARIQSKLIDEGVKGCQKWTGAVCGHRFPRYGKMRAKFPNDNVSKHYYVHRLAYMIEHNLFELPRGLHVSHLCHFSLCCNPRHLSLEPQIVNNSRQQCTEHCFGHGDFPNCII